MCQQLETINQHLATASITRAQAEKANRYLLETEEIIMGMNGKEEAAAARPLESRYGAMKAQLLERLRMGTVEPTELELLFQRQERAMGMLERYLDSLDSEDNAEAIRTQLNRIENQLNQLDNTDQRIMDLATDFNVDYIRSGRYTQAVLRTNQVTSATMARLDQGRSRTIPNITNGGSDLVRLPPLNVPKLNGKTQEWPTFKDHFNQLIMNKPLTSE